MDDQHHLLILSKDSERFAALIRQHDFEKLHLGVYDSQVDVRKQLEQCNIILGEPNKIAPILDATKKIKWVQSTWAGVDDLMRSPVRKDYILTGVKGIHDAMMSEYVWAYIIGWERRIFQIRANQEKKIWKPIHYASLKGKRLGVCGMGYIGKHIARVAKQFGMEVWGYKRTAADVAEADRLFAGDEFNLFLTQPDYIVITLPNTPETYHLFDKAAFEAMKKTAVLINVGRGSVVSESALIQALDENKIGGAILDVFETEPLPPDSPLWTHARVLITPHISSLSFPEDIVPIFAENYRRFISDQPLLHVIDFNQGY